MSANVGGQAVLEGVMMRSPGTWAVTVRRSDGELARVCRPISSAASRHRWMRLPIIRGVVALGESLVIGFRALSVSATYASIQPGEEADAEEAAELTRGQIAFAFVIAIGFALIIFKVSPAIITGLLPIHSTALFVVVEGGIRVSFLIAYLALISLVPDLRRVFQYHAAEHKAINAYEDGAELDARARPVVLQDPRPLRDGLPALGDGHRHLRLRLRRPARLAGPDRLAHRAAAGHRGSGIRGHPVRREAPAEPGRPHPARSRPLASVAHDARADARPGRGVDPGAARRPRRGGGRRGPLSRRGHGVSSRACRKPTPPTRSAS